MIFKRYKGFIIINDFELNYIGLEIKNKTYYNNEINTDPIEDKALKDGQILKSSYLIDTIVKMKSKIKFKPDCYELTITAEDIKYKNLQLPKQNKSDLKETLKVEVERMLNEHFNEVVFDYSILSKDNEDTKILIVLANKNLIENYHYIFYNTLGNINRITIRQESIWRLMNNLLGGKDAMFLEVYSDEIYLTAGNSDSLYFSRKFKKHLEEFPNINEIIEMADNYIIREFNRKPIKKILLWNRSNNLPDTNRVITDRIENLELIIEDENISKNNILNTTPLLLPGLGMIKYGN